MQTLGAAPFRGDPEGHVAAGGQLLAGRGAAELDAEQGVLAGVRPKLRGVAARSPRGAPMMQRMRCMRTRLRRGTHGDDDRARPGSAASVLASGLLAGAAGAAAMTLAEKIEQAITGRPNSYVPAHTLERLLGLQPRPDRERQGRLVRPFAAEVAFGDCWLTRLKSRSETPALSAFRAWLLAWPEVSPDAP